MMVNWIRRCARTQVGWSKWKEASGVLFDKGIPEMVKGKLYATMVRPAMIYGSECWAIEKEHVHRLEVEESRMLRCMIGVKWQDKLENEYIRVKAGVEGIGQKLRQSRLR